MGAFLAGGVLGAGLGLWQAYEQKRANDIQLDVANKQYAMAKEQAALEEQERNKADQKEVDIENLLSENTSSDLNQNVLSSVTKEDKKNRINKKASLLGE